MSGSNSAVCHFISTFIHGCVSCSARVGRSACTRPTPRTDWLLDLTGDVIVWRRSDAHTTAGLRAPVMDLSLTIYRRMPVHSGRVEVTGDAELVDFWLERVGFG